MADPSPFNDSNSDTDEDRTPLWVKVFGIIAIVLVRHGEITVTGRKPAIAMVSEILAALPTPGNMLPRGLSSGTWQRQSARAEERTT